MYYLISGWDDKGNQIVEYHFGNNETEAEQSFIKSIGGGEVNEILDTISDQDYEEAIRESERKDEINMTNRENNNYNKAIKCIETGKTYISIAEAAREMNCSSCNIVSMLKGRQKVAKGYHFEYLSEEETRKLLNSIEPKEVIIQRKAIIRGKGKSLNGNTNAVLCISTGDVFTSCTDAAMNADSTVGHMSHVCRGNGNTVKGKKYCYVKDINEHLDEVAESIRKANMYDEFMTKEEKRKELVANVEHWESETKRISDEMDKLFNDSIKANEELDKARRELMYFTF